MIALIAMLARYARCPHAHMWLSVVQAAHYVVRVFDQILGTCMWVCIVEGIVGVGAQSMVWIGCV